MSEYSTGNWYPDPQEPGLLRWWDGTRWTDNVRWADPAAAVQPGAGGARTANWAQTQAGPGADPGAAWAPGTWRQSGGGAGDWQSATRQADYGGWPPSDAPAASGWQQPGSWVPGATGYPGGPFPPGSGGSGPGRSRKVLWSALAACAAAVAVVVIIVLAVHGGSGSKPTAQSRSTTGAPGAMPTAGSGSAGSAGSTGSTGSTGATGTAAQCAALEHNPNVSSVTNQLVSLGNQFKQAVASQNTAEEASIAQQMSGLYSQQAQNAASVPALAKVLRTESQHMHQLSIDISSGNQAAVTTDGGFLAQDAKNASKACGGTS